MADDALLHKLCQIGDIDKIVQFVALFPDRMALDNRLANRKGVFGYTPLHEAVASGHHDVLDYLLKKAGDTHVNCRANSGYTPLHLAASSGHGECVRVLLKHNADISVTDEYGKTPKQTAELSSKIIIVRILRGAEILKEVRTNGNNLTELLQAGVDQLEPDCLNKALIAAVENDHHQNVGKLIVKGATNISEALKLAVTERKVYASAMLMLVYAAIDGNCNLVRQLFDEIGIDEKPCEECSQASGSTYALFARMLNSSTTDDLQDCLHRIRRALKSSNMPTTIPIEIARRNIDGQSTTSQKSSRCAHVRVELLMKTDVNKEDKSVHWQGLGLRTIEAAWLKRINWVKTLLIGRNQLKDLPMQMGVHLKQVTKLDIQYNELEKISADLLLLPCLVDLNLSHNMLQELPAVLEWSPSLTTLDLSHNNLRSFPPSVEAPSMIKLSIANNNFRSVPKSVCSFSSLQFLDISDNQDILNLPVEMGRLSNLTTLILTNLKDLHDPPRAVQGDARDCIHYLNQKLHRVKSFYKMKLMLVGCAERGKTTLVAALQGEEYCEMPRTVGVDVSEWKYRPRYPKPNFYFSIWDFGGQKEYYSTHQCFLSKRSMYLLVFNLTHADRGVQEMKPWLNNIALRAPWSCVIIVGTHLDLIEEGQRAIFVNGVLHKVKRLAQAYSKLIIPEVVPVSLRHAVENINLLKDTIYKNAAEYKYKRQLVMGQQIPASYHKLDKQLQIMREARREMRQPIMHHKEFQSLVQQMNLNIHDDGELRTATIFLRDVGTLLHYDDRTHNLHELYFIDPHWLCKMMAKIVGPDLGGRTQIKDGILHKDQIRGIFSESDKDFPVKYFQQYLTLLYRFEIALPLDESKILVTSMLDSKRPSNVDIEKSRDPPFHTRYITFGSAETPPGFWSRYLSRIMYSIPQASDALHLNTTIPTTLIESMSLGISGEVCQYPAPSKVTYWESGFFFNDGQVSFRVESLSGSRMKHSTEEHGILMVASPNCPELPNNEGIKIIGQLVDMALSLLRELYPGLTEIKQRIPCYECVRMCRQNPYEFNVEECWLAMEEQKSTIECKYDIVDPTKNHTMVVSKIVPDLFLQDIDHNFLLSQSQIKNEEILLTRPTDYEKICKGIYHGKFVTIMYPYKSKEALSKIRSEVRELQKWHHPCLACLMGVIVHPRIAIVIEKAPENSLEWPLITQKSPIHRITLFRIAAQVAAALRFLHKNRLLFRALQASNVLMWTVDPDSLCHCKLANYAISTQLHQTRIRGLHDTRGFVAPEVLHMGGGARYNEKADIFSFGMLLYQIISRNNPYHDAKDNSSFYAAVQKGERPKLPNEATTAFHYLTLVMEACWDGNPENRPNAQNLLTYMCLSSTQAVMSVISTNNDSSMRQAQVVKTQRCNDVWICSDGKEGLEINVYSLNTMKKTKSQLIKNIFSSMCLCKDYLWIATRSGVSYGRLSIFNPANHRQEYEIPQWDYMVSCISCSDDYVYIGTIDGLCFSFPINLKRIKHNPKPIKRELPETKPINDILPVTHAGKKSLWVSHTRYIYFVLPDTLEMEHVQYRGNTDDLVGKLCTTPHDSSVVWSAHIGGSMLSAWDVGSRSMRFEVNVSTQLSEVYQSEGGGQHAIAAMTTALDTVWVGMTSGHILVFADQALLTWYRPYNSYVQFITVIPGFGPCKTEECMILTGGQKLKRLIPASLKECNVTGKGTPGQGGAAMILWEAFSKKATTQVRYIEMKSSELFENFKNLRETLKKENLGFKDGTHILPEDTFVVKMFGEENVTFEVTCPKPLKIAALFDKIQKKINAPDRTFKLEYTCLAPESCIKEVWSQKDIETYAKLEDRPELLCYLIPTT